MYQQLKNHRFLVIIATIGIIVAMLGLLVVMYQSRQGSREQERLSTETVSNRSKPDAILNGNESDSLVGYLYEKKNIEPSFYIYYPSTYTRRLSDGSGSWDITLLEDAREVAYIDMSGQGDKTLEESLIDWITLWGGLQSDYTYMNMEKGKHLNRDYSIYEVSLAAGNFIFLIYDAGTYTYDNSNAHMAIKAPTSHSELPKKLLLDITTE